MSDPAQNPDPNLENPSDAEAESTAAADQGSADSGSGTGDAQGAGSAAGTEAEPGEREAGQERQSASPELPQKRQDWRDRRIATITARNKELAERLAAYERGVGASNQAPTDSPPASAPDIESLAQARAREIAAAQVFNDACNAAAAKGRQDYPDFDSRVGALRGMINPGDPSEAAAYSQFLTAALETGEAPRLIYELGGNLDEASRILALSPVKMAVELAKLSTRAPEALSNAPRPPRPIAGGRQGPHTQISPSDPDRSDNLSTAEWMRRREAELRARSA